MKFDIDRYTITVTVSDPYTQQHHIVIEHPEKATYSMWMGREAMERFVSSLQGYTLACQ